MNDQEKLSWRKLLSESLMRELILFFFLFILTVSQYWDNIFLFIFPLITFGYYLFFKILSIIKWRIKFSEDLIIYSPLGVEKRHANRFFFASLFNQILLFWIGAESLYHPQLIADYSNYFIIIFIFIYTLSFFWIFIDIWKYGKIQIILPEEKSDLYLFDRKSSQSGLQQIIGNFKLKTLKLISIGGFVIFFSANIFNIILVYLNNQNLLVGFILNYPGTGLLNSKGLGLSYLIILILLVPPIFDCSSFLLIYKDIINIDKEKFNSILSSLPKNLQVHIKQNIISINKKFKQILTIE